MKISIADRLHPFSHKAGVLCVLPFSTLSFQFFPAYIKVFELSQSAPQLIEEFPIKIQGPLKEFTVELSLEKGYIKVWGQTAEGMLRYVIQATPSSNRFTINFEKLPNDRILNAIPKKYLEKIASIPMPSIENLSLGVSKSQDWEMVTRRMSLSEIIPFWFRLGQILPIQSSHFEGTASLLKDIEKTIVERNFSELASSLTKSLISSFDGILSPRLFDNEYSGIDLPAVVSKNSSSTVLLTDGAANIRSMFIKQNEKTVSVLPCLLPEFHSGRLTNVNIGSLGMLDIEWSKKTIRRMRFLSKKSNEIHWIFQKDVKNFRLRTNEFPRGKPISNGDTMQFQSGIEYLFDNFTR